MSSILDRLNAGEFHRAARAARPDCVDSRGNIHRNAARAAFADWCEEMRGIHGADSHAWPVAIREEYRARYVPSH